MDDVHGRVEHDARVARIARMLADHPGGRPLSLRKRSVSHMVPKLVDARRSDDKIDISDLHHILAIDVARRLCVAEPGVTFVDLVEATLPHGLVPRVVPELETITIGGAVTGASVESMSFRHGGFHDSCVEYEVLTTSGETLRCTPDGPLRNVFEMMHGSFGTLGILTKLVFQLVPAKPFVKVEYERHRTMSEYVAAIRRHAADETLDFMDGILHAEGNFVLSLGRFVDHAPYTHRYDWVKVYYRTTRNRREDYFRTKDYFFRYDRGVTNPTPRSFMGRLLLGKLLSSTRVLQLAEWGHKWFLRGTPDVTLDMFLPLENLEKFLDWYRGSIGHYPLWCVPYRLPRTYDWVADGYFDGLKDPSMFVDIALYGLAQPPGRNLYKEIEDELPNVAGIKTLIAHNYYDEASFWKTWNKANYDAAKAATDPRGLLRGLYEKMCPGSARSGARLQET
ncbi:MAG: FAD/FMN-containing dehydrogenase [Labilithrix sp.]|nr:FAD/FMN-containing dehydrogenase [Labilithrix sp.]